ncbi:MAG: hypothetical protein HYZ14_16175 [Bacteroidetes bacterium]|nr:hypothetical protein [Bacteroidota bacterium]
MVKRILTSALFVIAALTVYAGNSEYSIRKNRAVLNATPGSNEIAISYPVSPFYVAPDEIRNYGKITLTYNRESHSDLTHAYPWRYTVTMHVFENGAWQTGSPVTLTVHSEPASNSFIYADYHLFETDDPALERKIQVVDVDAEYYSGGVWVDATNDATDSHIPADIHLELSIKTERFYELSAVETHFIQFNGTTGELRWPFVQGAEEYDVEWVFLDVYSLEYQQVMDAIAYATAQSGTPGIDFADNYSGSLPFELKEPTRVNVFGNRYKLDMTYPEGALFFRMRPVGRYVGATENPGGDYESVKPGAWTYTISDHPSNQIISETVLCRHAISAAAAFAASQNWLYGVNYAEDGKSVSTLSYYDGAARGRQAAVYNTSDDITLVGESKFDYEGRQTVSVIPAPVQGRNFNYQNNFNQNTGNLPFDKDDFDKTTPEPLDIDPTGGTKGAAQYFSVNNTFTGDQYRSAIPEADGYVYSQVRFNKDATGRISETSGIGEDFKMGSSHTVKYYYGNTTEFELRRLFGKEVGEADNYKKVIVVDPNGQASVSYQDNHGRVIATGLAGNAPTNLVELGGTSTAATTALSTHNVVNSDVEKTSKIVIPNYAGTSSYTFHYDLDGVLYGVENPTNTSQILCVECEYEFSFVVVKPDGTAETPVILTFSKDGLETCTATAGIVNYQPSNGSNLTFGPYTFSQIGEYEVYKKLTVSSNTQTNFSDQVEAIIGTEEDFVAAALENVDVAGCYTNCDDYCDYVAGINYDAANPSGPAWSTLSLAAKQATTYWDDCMTANCNIMEAFDGDAEDQADVTNGEDIEFGTISQCNGIRTQMEAQVSPGGIFYTDVTNTLSSFWSLFPGTISTLNLYTAYNPDGSPATGATVVNSPSYLQTAANFQTEWLPTFLTFHREYCHYQVCLELNAMDNGSGINSMEFDMLMAPTQAWTSGTADPYITLTGHPDPFVGSTPDLVTSTTSDLLVLLTTLDEPCTTGTVDLEVYVDHLFGPCSLSTTAVQWDVFYGMYQNLKQTQINAYKTSIATNYAAGCTYHEDADAIVENAVIGNDPDGGSDGFTTLDIIYLETSLGGPGIAVDCGTTCSQNVNFWMDNLPADCIASLTVSSELDDLELELSEYCNASCQTGNIGGWLYDDGSTLFDNFAADVNTIFTSNPECILDNMLVTTGTFSVSTAELLIENPCLGHIIDAFNADGNFASGGITITGTAAASCNPPNITGPLVADITLSNELQATTTDCVTEDWIFRVFDLNGNAVALTSIASFSDLTISQVSATLAYITIHPVSGSPYAGYLDLSRCYSSTSQNVISYTPPTTDWTADCINEAYLEAMVQAQNAYSSLYNQTLSNLINQVSCMDGIAEVYTMDYVLKEYQYTLYYYDQAGNLVSTVPPLGVHALANTAFGTDGHWNGTTQPAHTYQTLYEYNGANLLTSQSTPDGGVTNYYYDDLYRLRFSQNAQQLVDNKFSYTKFDELGRIVEAGEAGDPALATINFLPELNNYTYPGTGLRRDYAKTYYEQGYTADPTIAAVFDNGQQNLRNRIGAVEQFTASGYSATGGAVAAYGYGMVRTISSFSYDEHGNVNELVQTNSTLVLYDQQHKKIEYDYDLLSGNVKEVIYQPGELDEWRHKYHYDANNRLVRTFTSDDGEEWEMDAKYFYYLHGSLARVETGHDKVQGTDYAYNLQGWLKGANGTFMDAAKDLGEDGHTSGLDKYSGQDAYGYYLGYFSGDYSNIGTTDNFANTDYLVTQNGTFGSLYNGNITHMVTALKDINEAPIAITGNIYKYDQLQRISNMNVYQVAPSVIYTTDYATNGFNSTSAIYSDAYHEAYTYDANGNIQTLLRYGNNAALVMDNFTYDIDDTNERNRLLSVGDVAAAGSYTVDVDNQAAGNYTYNDIGQLITDTQEGITNIEWTVTGKVHKIHKGSDVIEFVYDALGNRVMKVENGVDNTAAVYTYYVHDAGGNVMATYTREITAPFGIEETNRDQLKLAERMIYGSKRLGVKNENRLLAQFDFTPDQVLAGGYYQAYASYTATTNYPQNFEKEKRKVMEKFYEFSNHLGNVLEVTTDRKVANTAQTAYEADVISYSDYYPFGMVMPGRNGSTDQYRYGFQGQEGDNEIKGEGNSVNYKYRMHDPRLGRFLAVDPLTSKYPFYSPYTFSGNRVIDATELEGQEPVTIHGTWSNPWAWGYMGWAMQMLAPAQWSSTDMYGHQWSGWNNSKHREKGARSLEKSLDIMFKSGRYDNKPLMIMTHSHGRQVAVTYINNNIHKLKESGKEVVLITLNGPSRPDYVLSDEASEYTFLVNIWNPDDKVVPNAGGTSRYIWNGKGNMVLVPWTNLTVPTGEKGPASLMDPQADLNIEYEDQYQGLNTFKDDEFLLAFTGHRGWLPLNVAQWEPAYYKAMDLGLTGNWHVNQIMCITEYGVSQFGGNSSGWNSSSTGSIDNGTEVTGIDNSSSIWINQ